MGRRTITLKTKNYKDEEIEYEFNKTLYYILKRIQFRVMNKLDGVIIIDGFVGAGKSNLGTGICGTWETFFKRRHNLDNVHFIVESVVKFTDREGNETMPCHFDESIQGGSSRDTITKGGHLLKITLITKRRKRHIYLFVVDNIKELSEKIVERCNVYINVQYKETQFKIIKGITRIFSKREALKIWSKWKEGSINKYKQAEAQKMINNKWSFICPDYSNIWFSEDEYDKKKVKETKLLEVKSDKVMEQRNKAIMCLLDKGVKQQEIGNAIGLSRSLIADIKAKMSSLSLNTYSTSQRGEGK